MKPRHPLEVMEDWECPLWERQVGTWRSHYVVRDIDGTILDEHDAINDIAFSWEDNHYAQRNIYTRNGRSETRQYGGHWNGRTLVIASDRLSGSARAHDERVIILNFRTFTPPGETFETIILMSDTNRSRVMQHFDGTRLRAVTSVIDEVRISPIPAIDHWGRVKSKE